MKKHDLAVALVMIGISGISFAQNRSPKLTCTLTNVVGEDQGGGTYVVSGTITDVNLSGEMPESSSNSCYFSGQLDVDASVWEYDLGCGAQFKLTSSTSISAKKGNLFCDGSVTVHSDSEISEDDGNVKTRPTNYTNNPATYSGFDGDNKNTLPRNVQYGID